VSAGPQVNNGHGQRAWDLEEVRTTSSVPDGAKRVPGDTGVSVARLPMRRPQPHQQQKQPARPDTTIRKRRAIWMLCLQVFDQLHNRTKAHPREGGERGPATRAIKRRSKVAHGGACVISIGHV
jgi:hypothetical protein